MEILIKKKETEESSYACIYLYMTLNTYTCMCMPFVHVLSSSKHSSMRMGLVYCVMVFFTAWCHASMWFKMSLITFIEAIQ